jgi:hypothetical protein
LPDVLGVTTYEVIVLPPLLLGAVQDTVAVVSPALAVTPVGAAGTDSAVGVTELDAVDAAPLPTELVAVTVNVYAVPGVSPLMFALVTGGALLMVTGVCAADPMYGVTV